MALLRSRRLEAVLGAPVELLTAADIERLVENQTSEDFDLDFKTTLYGNSDSDRRDMCGDVAALANGSGGVIILGVEDDDRDVAVNAPGVALGDAERNRMRQVLASGVAPLPAVDILAVGSEESSTHGFFVLAVPRSTRAPHAVIVNTGFRFPVRNGATTRYLSEPEVAAAYRRRDLDAGAAATKLAALLTDSQLAVHSGAGPWLHVALVPEHAGALEIDQSRLRLMQTEWASTDIFEAGTAGAHFDWVRTGRGMYRVGDAPHAQASSRLPHYGYVTLHVDGCGSYAVQLVDIAHQARRSGLVADGATDEMVADETLALGVLSAVRRLAVHARDVAGAAGAVSLLTALAPSPGGEVAIGHRRSGFVESRSGNVVATAAVAETAASLDDVAEVGPAFISAIGRLLNEIGHSFGIPEMGQFSDQGQIRRRYWSDFRGVHQWAEAHDVAVTDAAIGQG